GTSAPATGLAPRPRYGSDRSRRRHNARTGCAGTPASSTCRRRSARTGSPAAERSPRPVACPPCAQRCGHPPSARATATSARCKAAPMDIGMTLDRLEHQLPVDAVEEALDVEVENPVIAPAALAGLGHGIDCRLARPVAVGVGMKDRLQDRLQITTDDLLSDAAEWPRKVAQPAWPAV